MADPRTYVFPQSFALNTIIPIMNNNNTSQTWNKTIGETVTLLVNKAISLGITVNAITMEPYNTGNTIGYLKFKCHSITGDTVYCCDNTWIGKESAQVNSSGFAGLPTNSNRWYFYDENSCDRSSQSTYDNNFTVNDRRYIAPWGLSSTYPTIAVLLDYSGTVYLNEVNITIPTYIWHPFDTLNGNSGQYRCKLTMINEDKIGDYTTPTITSDIGDFDRISEQASLLSYFQNAPLGEPVTVAWSGDNWLTMTVTKNPEPDTKDYLLNLQFRYALTQSIIYSYNARIQLEDYRHIPYLSFILDDDEEVAVFDCVTYYSASAGDPNPHWGYLGRNQTEAAMHALWLWLQDSLGSPESDSPFNGGTTDNGGEGGNPTPQDDMPRPSLPSLDAANLGFFTVYNFTDSDETQLQSIADFLWSDNVLDNFKKYFTNFSDNIFALYILPYTPSTLPTKNFKVGHMESETITNVKYLVSRYVDIPMGKVKVDPRWTSYVDYSPYTRFELYLPGIGIHSIDADDIMSPANSNGVLKRTQGSTISIKYTLDLFTGIVVAFVFIDSQMRYQFSGKVGQTIPISGENYNSMVTAFITGAASLASSIASGGLSAPLAGAAVAGTITAQKPEVYRSGNMSGDVSLMSERTPYLIRHVPNKPKIIKQERYTGFPSYKTGKVKDFGGYFEAVEIHVEGISCTEDERDELIELFKSGVIL